MAPPDTGGRRVAPARHQRGSRPPIRRVRAHGTVLFGLLVPALATGCTSGSPWPGEITDGVWAGAGGPDTFLFELRGTAPDSLAGTVHVMRDGKNNSQLAITMASHRPPDLEVFIESTNATYRGRVDLARGRIRGGLTFGGRPGSEMELRWMDPSGLPGFAAMEEAGPYVYRQPPGGLGSWSTASPEEVGLRRMAIEALVNAVVRGEAGLIHSLAIVRNSRLVVDEYFHGFTPDDLHRLASTTKSVSSLLVGAAIDRGLIGSVEEPILGLLGRREVDPGSPWQGEKLRHLLTMTMGLDWSGGEAEEVRGTGPAFFRQVLERRVAQPPGSVWSYVSADVDLLAGVIFNATGRHADAFAEETLFGPLGIAAYHWEHGKQRGYNLMDGSLELRPRDLAKIGAMVAAGGRWNDRQVISSEWIEESTRTHIGTGQLPALGGYGYLWWTGELPTSRGSQPIVVANGWGSQFIVIFPELDMVVVTTGGNDDNGRHLDIGEVLVRTLLASLQAVRP